ncbi:MAG: hypothetical protein IJM17_08820 [Firmicutes bacterium]|nr:hypothetical protein [Bacillota bacterium]
MSSLICFFGGDSQTGTTLLSEAVCLSLSAKGKKVLFIMASGEQSEGYLPQPPADLGTLLRISRLIKEDVKNCIASGRDFDYIAGSRDLLKKQFYDPALIGRIKAFVSKDYDYIVCDGGHDASLPLPVSCLAAADRRYYVLSGGVKCVTRFSETWQAVIRGLGLDISGDRLVLNKADAGLSGYGLSDLASAFSLEGFSVPRYENERLYEFSGSCAYGKVPSYSAAVDLIADDIAKGSAR